MDMYKSRPKIAGILFIVGTAAGLASAILTQPVMNDPNYLQLLGGEGLRIGLGALCIMVMALALVFIPVVLYPVLRNHNPDLALGYVVFRALEAVTYFLTVICMLGLVTVSQGFLAADNPGIPAWHVAEQVLRTLLDRGIPAVLNIAIFPAGALMFYYILHRARLVPAWLTWWAIIGAVLYAASGMIGLFSELGPYATLPVALEMPLALQEMVLALWMIAKGFRPPESA